MEKKLFMHKKNILFACLILTSTNFLSSTDLRDLKNIILNLPDTPEIDSEIVKHKNKINTVMHGFKPGMLPLSAAACYGCKHATISLLKHGAKINAVGYDNDTALHEAASKSNIEIIGILLDHGANIHSQNVYGEKPIDSLKRHITQYEDYVGDIWIAQKARQQAALLFLQAEEKWQDPKNLCRLWVTGAVRTSKMIDKAEKTFLDGAYKPASTATNTRDLFKLPTTGTRSTTATAKSWSVDQLD